LEYTTVYSREPNTLPDGSPRIYVRRLDAATMTKLGSLFATNFTPDRVAVITNTLRRITGNISSPLQFFLSSTMTSDEFAQVADQITTVTNAFVDGRININTANAAVLYCIPGLSNYVSQIVSYRQANPDKLTSIAWLIDGVGLKGSDATALATQIGNRITTRSYQFLADVAAIGPFGRGYRRVRFIFDTSDGTARIIYRRDFTHLGWALGKNVRQVWLAKNTEP
jgi:hypothetical protein